MSTENREIQDNSELNDTTNTGLFLTGDCTIYEIAEIHVQVKSELTQAHPVIDLSNVDRIDCSFIQLLVSAKKTALKNKKILSLHAMPKNINELFDVLHINSVLDNNLG